MFQHHAHTFMSVASLRKYRHWEQSKALLAGRADMMCGVIFLVPSGLDWCSAVSCICCMQPTFCRPLIQQQASPWTITS
jgi:hypothetical protein